MMLVRQQLITYTMGMGRVQSSLTHLSTGLRNEYNQRRKKEKEKNPTESKTGYPASYYTYSRVGVSIKTAEAKRKRQKLTTKEIHAVPPV
jgi:hypothetical protein